MNSPDSASTDDEFLEWMEADADETGASVPVDFGAAADHVPHADKDHESSLAAAQHWGRPGRCRGPHNNLSRVQWRTADLFAGLMFLAIWRGLSFWLVANEQSLPAGLLFAIGAVLPVIVIGLFPAWAYCRGGGRRPVRWPSVRCWALELTIAIPMLLVLFVTVGIISYLWQHCFGQSPGMDPRMQEVAFSGNPWLLAIMAIGACVWAPLAEELFFRGFLQNALSQRLPVVAASLLQIAIFALVHPYSGVHLVAVGVIGAGLTLHYLWRRTLIASMLLHGLFNGLMLTLVGMMMLAVAESGALGVQLDTTAERCRITGVYQGSGADSAGLQGGDIITAVNGEATDTLQALQLLLLGCPPGEEIELTIERAGQTRDVPLQLSSRQGMTTVIREVEDAD
ncbi:MAG: type II CAAX prenyl endopeptidase Rce1 family protein [Planctomycetaceae bacterium]